MGSSSKVVCKFCDKKVSSNKYNKHLDSCRVFKWEKKKAKKQIEKSSPPIYNIKCKEMHIDNRSINTNIGRIADDEHRAIATILSPIFEALKTKYDATTPTIEEVQSDISLEFEKLRIECPDDPTLEMLSSGDHRTERANELLTNMTDMLCS